MNFLDHAVDTGGTQSWTGYVSVTRCSCAIKEEADRRGVRCFMRGIDAAKLYGQKLSGFWLAGRSG